MCSLLTKRSGACIWLGDYAGAIDFARAAEELGLKNHSRINVMIAQALAGYAEFCQRDSRDAAERPAYATPWPGAAYGRARGVVGQSVAVSGKLGGRRKH